MQKPCSKCGHLATEHTIDCPCSCHNAFRIKSFTTKKEQKVHELAVLVTQLVVTVISLWKFVKGSKTVKSIENEKR